MTWKIITGLFVIVAGIGGITKFDDRYAKCESTKKGFENLEIKIVQTLDKFQQTQDIRQYDMMQESLERDYSNCKRHQMSDPTNPSLAEECRDIKREKERMREKKKSLMGG